MIEGFLGLLGQFHGFVFMGSYGELPVALEVRRLQSQVSKPLCPMHLPVRCTGLKLVWQRLRAAALPRNDCLVTPANTVGQHPTSLPPTYRLSIGQQSACRLHVRNRHENLDKRNP